MLETFIQISSVQKRYEDHYDSAADLILNIGVKIDINAYKVKGYLNHINYSEKLNHGILFFEDEKRNKEILLHVILKSMKSIIQELFQQTIMKLIFLIKKIYKLYNYL